MDQPDRAGLDATTTARFYRSALYPLLTRINAYLVRWIRKKYKRLRPSGRPSRRCRRSPSDTPACSRTGG